MEKETFPKLQVALHMLVPWILDTLF